MPVVEDEEVVACQRGGEQGNQSQRGQRKAVSGNVRWREIKELQQVETG